MNSYDILPYQKSIGHKMNSGKSNEEIVENVVDCIMSGRNVHLCGPGGVGKSWVIKNVTNKLRNLGYVVNVTATTGVAAVGLIDPELKVTAETLHRWAGIGTGTLPVQALINKVMSKKKTRSNWMKCKVLIIDEISMLGYSLLQTLCGVAKGVRKNDSTPMAGIQMIVSGDWLQLPPVKDDWPFKTPEWEQLNFRPFILEKPYRYEDIAFFELLLRIRKGKHTTEDVKLLRQRVRANQSMQKLLQSLKDVNPADVIRPTMFYSRKNDVDNYNFEKLEELKGDLVNFDAVDDMIALSDKKQLKIEDYLPLLDEDMPRTVSFKVGSQVMLKVNLDVEAKLVNGSRGVVTEIVPKEALIVKFLNGKTVRVDVHRRALEMKKVTVTRTQIPFVLADAMTIHKAQGATLDYCVADLGPTVFSDGQAYVALSRCRTIQGLFLSEFCSSSVHVNKEALKYIELIEQKAIEEDSNISKRMNT